MGEGGEEDEEASDGASSKLSVEIFDGDMVDKKFFMGFLEGRYFSGFLKEGK